MSSVTSLRVSKGTNKFAPKAKPRPNRRGKGAQGGSGTQTETERSEAGSTQASAPSTQPQTPAATTTEPASATEPPVDNEPAIPAVSQRLRATQIAVPSVSSSANGSGIPVVGSTQHPPAAAQSGTPIVVGASARTPVSPLPRRPQQPQLNRRPSVIGSPVAIPASSGRLASLSSPARAIPMPRPLFESGSSRDVAELATDSPNKRRRVRSSTPSSEPRPPPKLKTVNDYTTLSTEEINNLPISTFCRDTRHGRPTTEFISRENESIKKMLARSSGTEAEPDSSAAAAAANRANGGQDGDSESQKQKSKSAVNHMAAQIRIVDGKVVVDADSLVVNRSDMGGGNDEPLEVVDESARSRFINSMTYVKKRGSRKRWSKEETELFYQALRKYGTDFEMISGAMPGRSRYDIRNKFKAEEKIHGSWITTALLRRPRPTPVSAPVVPQDGIPSELANYSMATSPKPANDEELPEPGNLIAPAGRAQEPSTEAEAAPGGGNADIFDLGLLTPATQPR